MKKENMHFLMAGAVMVAFGACCLRWSWFGRWVGGGAILLAGLVMAWEAIHSEKSSGE